jgi:hypothetical protein
MRKVYLTRVPRILPIAKIVAFAFIVLGESSRAWGVPSKGQTLTRYACLSCAIATRKITRLIVEGL